MSLSQKYSGKILVPWYNSNEWRHVNTLVNSNENEDHVEALKCLHLWKIRTPLLFAGIEGTIIILEALTSEKDTLQEDQIKQIYALSLMRFLNVCATNSDKQGKFTKTLAASDLPKWLINIRHDIAHNHKLPELPVLELGLSICFSWLKENYWHSQNDIIMDYIVHEGDHSQLLNLLTYYISLNLDTYKSDTKYFHHYEDEEFLNLCKLVVPKQLKIKNRASVLAYVETELKENLTTFSGNYIKEIVAEKVVKDILFKVQLDSPGIMKDYKNLWAPLFNMLHEGSILFNVLEKLFEVTLETTNSRELKITASYWILDFFKTFTKNRHIQNEFSDKEINKSDNKFNKFALKKIMEKHPEIKDTLDINMSIIPIQEAHNFQQKILEKPNEYMMIYLDSILHYNNCSDEFINETHDLIQSYLITKYPQGSYRIMDSVEFLNDIKNDNDENQIPVVEKVNSQNTQSKWKPITDVECYDGLPLGVLPSQSRESNPLIIF
ncbi:uncharacterized protein LOC109600021 [Aethina tumida]|uniref:uncharacterized protein LOC109600021 n=1 Tax=Aethina tumida TaxID=116153 RepID=UPI00096B2B65|nr:uncharacterized protein LOC109600021 [Aethina tumida]XP_049818474.1 uncharacterized protein LOC109600021 [Aethina tumida]